MDDLSTDKLKKIYNALLEINTRFETIHGLLGLHHIYDRNRQHALAKTLEVCFPIVNLAISDCSSELQYRKANSAEVKEIRPQPGDMEVQSEVAYVRSTGGTWRPITRRVNLDIPGYPGEVKSKFGNPDQCLIMDKNNQWWEAS